MAIPPPNVAPGSYASWMSGLLIHADTEWPRHCVWKKVTPAPFRCCAETRTCGPSPLAVRSRQKAPELPGRPGTHAIQFSCLRHSLTIRTTSSRRDLATRDAAKGSSWRIDGILFLNVCWNCRATSTGIAPSSSQASWIISNERAQLQYDARPVVSPRSQHQIHKVSRSLAPNDPSTNPLSASRRRADSSIVSGYGLDSPGRTGVGNSERTDTRATLEHLGNASCHDSRVFSIRAWWWLRVPCAKRGDRQFEPRTTTQCSIQKWIKEPFARSPKAPPHPPRQSVPPPTGSSMCQR
jgi:hypothetical protein